MLLVSNFTLLGNLLMVVSIATAVAAVRFIDTGDGMHLF